MGSVSLPTIRTSDATRDKRKWPDQSLKIGSSFCISGPSRVRMIADLELRKLTTTDAGEHVEQRHPHV